MTDDIFSSALEELASRNLLRAATAFEAADARTVTAAGRTLLLFCGNDYFGLSHDPRIISAVREGLDRYGWGSGGSRLISGSRGPHARLEEATAAFLNTEAALLFGSGFAANSGVIPAIAGKGDLICADRLNHASLVDGCLLSRAEFARYPHADMAALEKLLQKGGAARTRWIVTDGLFSMDGDMAPLDAICALAGKYDARVYVDDAHAFGVMGKHGRGTPELFGVEGKIDILMGTYGKAAGGMGAFAAGRKSTIDYLLNRARSFIFSTAMPAAAAQGNLAAVTILRDFETERNGFRQTTERFHGRLSEAGFAISSKSYIIPIVIGDAGDAVAAAKALWEEGLFLQAVRPPAVPEGTSRLRLTLSLAQTEEDREKAIGGLVRHLGMRHRGTGQ